MWSSRSNRTQSEAYGGIVFKHTFVSTTKPPFLADPQKMWQRQPRTKVSTCIIRGDASKCIKAGGYRKKISTNKNSPIEDHSFVVGGRLSDMRIMMQTIETPCLGSIVCAHSGQTTPRTWLSVVVVRSFLDARADLPTYVLLC